MTAVMIGGSRLRQELLTAALGEPVTWWRPSEAPPAVEDVRLVTLCPDTLAEQADGNDRLAHLRSGVLASILPLQGLAAGPPNWCRVVWTLSSAGLAGTADPVRAAIEHAALGVMRNVTREFAEHWSTAAVVLDGVPVEQRERRLAAAVALLADPATRFYTGQVMRLAAPSGTGEVTGRG